MKRTIKGKLTTAVILIVALVMLVSTFIIVGTTGRNLKGHLTKELQYSADKYANSINSWIEHEKGLNSAGAIALASLPDEDYEQSHMQTIVTKESADRPELLNLYYGTEDKLFVQTDPEAETPEGYDPTARGWYKAAKAAGTTIVTDPYMDVLIGGMCITIASPVYRDGQLVGVLGADFTLDYITEVVNSIPYEAGEYGFLIDSAGNYVMHINDDFLPGEDSAVAVSSVMGGITSIVTSPGSAAIETADYDGEKNYFVTSNVEGCGFLLGLAIPAKNITVSTNRMILISMIISVVAVIAVILIMTKLIGQQLAPMENMKSFIKDKIIGENESSTVAKSEVEEISYLLSELESRFIDAIYKTKNESQTIKEKMMSASEKINGINDSINEINEAMHRTEGGIMEQTSSIQNIENICNDVTQASDSFSQDTRQMNEKTDEIIGRVEAIVPEILRNKEHAVNVTTQAKEELEEALKGIRVSEHIIKFLTENVLSDYDNLETLANNYMEDANYYNDISKDLGNSANRLNESISEISRVIETITGAQDELNNAVHDISGNMQNITLSSANVSDETRDVMDSIGTLQDTTGRFNV